MLISRKIARFNKCINNRIQGLWGWLIPPWAVIHHTGRRSGSHYRAVVVGFVGDDGFTVPLLYGERSDWAQNLVAGGPGTVRRGGRRYTVKDARIIPRADVTVRGLGRRYARAAPSALVATLVAQ